MVPVLLEDRAVISLSGLESRSFLQGLITNDIGRLDRSQPIYAALLTPQGKVLFDFLIFEHDGSLLLDCLRESRDALVKRLSMYRLRAKISIEPRDELAVFAEWGKEIEDKNLPIDPRLADLGRRGVSPRDARNDVQVGANAYLDHRLRLGVPEAADLGSDKIFALDADLGELNGVAFDKGCYIGQELTARMKHRGTARKRLVPIESKQGSLPVDDVALVAGGRSVGDITSRYGSRGFALIRLDRLLETGNKRIEAEGAEIVVHRPPWLSLEAPVQK